VKRPLQLPIFAFGACAGFLLRGFGVLLDGVRVPLASDRMKLIGPEFCGGLVPLPHTSQKI
jgi:hypothetical protein